MEPLLLAGATVGATVCISIVLVAFFMLREEKFEDHVAQQAGQEAALFTRSSSTKASKNKTKPVRRKKKHSENGGDGVGGGHEVEQVEESLIVENKEQDADDKPKSILKEKKNKPKKQPSKPVETEAAKERHTHFEDEAKPIVEEVVSVQESSPESALFAEPPKPEPVQEVVQSQPQATVNAEPPAPKKSKNKSKPSKEKPPSTTGEMSSKSLLNSVKTANLNATELQDLIDVLLNKQGDNAQWKSTTKGDDTEMLKKQLQEKEQAIIDEKKQSLNAANKLKEMRDEIQQERMKQKAQYTASSNKITAQTKELQAMQTRMKATHDSHAQEVQNLQGQLRHFQEMVNSSSMTSVQRLQEENAQLKNASMRASQLNADKESLSAELHKLQQSHRQVKTDLAARADQMQQMEGHRQILEKQVHDSKLQHSSKQEAEKVLNKRLSEVNEELKKAEARETKLNKTVKEQEQKCTILAEQLSKAENSKAGEADSMNTLTSKLTEATSRVSELEKMFTSVETQLKESQEKQTAKDKEIKDLKDRQQKSQGGNESQTNTALLKEKDDTISNLNEQLKKQMEELTNMKTSIEQEKKKNNDLRIKNWKAMEALSASEQSLKSEIAKAVKAAKAEAKEEAVHTKSGDNQELSKIKVELEEAKKELKTMEETIDQQKKKNNAEAKEEAVHMKSGDNQELSKIKVELEEAKKDLKTMEETIDQQKKKNNELREKNWKAMDAVSQAEKSAGTKAKEAVESIKKSSLKDMENERIAAKNVLTTLYPEITVESSLSFEKWLAEFHKQAKEVKPKIVENGDVSSELEESRKEMDQLKAECSHYKNGLEDTESMLKKLENHVESEISSWEKKLESALQDAHSAKSKLGNLEHDLKEAKSLSSSHLEKIKSLEKEIAAAKQNESSAKTKLSSLEKELSNSSDISKLEKELLQSRENEKKMCESYKKYESVQEELTGTVKELSDVQSQLTTRDSEVKSLREEIKRNQEIGEDFKKKIATLEEALAKANNDIGKSQKDKESKLAEKEEAKQVQAYKSEIEELKAQLKKAKETDMTRSQQIEKDVAEAMADAAAAKTAEENKVSSV